MKGVHNLGNPILADSSDTRSGNLCNGEAYLQRKKQWKIAISKSSFRHFRGPQPQPHPHQNNCGSIISIPGDLTTVHSTFASR